MASQIVSWDRSVRNGDPHVLYDLFDELSDYPVLRRAFVFEGLHQQVGLMS